MQPLNLKKVIKEQSSSRETAQLLLGLLFVSLEHYHKISNIPSVGWVMRL